MYIYLAQQYIDNSAKLMADKNAVAFSNKYITFDELYKCSNKLANCLLRNGVSRQDRVLLFLKRSWKIVISILGALKADAIYIPIESKIPHKRLKRIVEDCSPEVIICDGETIEKLYNTFSQSSLSAKIIILEYKDHLPSTLVSSVLSQECIDKQPNKCPIYRNIDNDIAYILYTSGSTGEPKGVMISHLNIINYIEWAVDYFAIDSDDKILNTAPFNFDMSTFDLYCSFKSGASLCITSESELLFPSKLIQLIENEGVTIWKAISSLLMYIACTVPLSEERMPTLKKIIFAGEQLPTKHLITWMKAFAKKSFYNAYGPTEATGISTYYHVKEIPKDPKTRIPIGHCCKNTEIYLLKEDDSLAKCGEIGEICIRGSGLSQGYLNDKVKTDRAFVKNPFCEVSKDFIYRTGDIARQKKDGNYELLGRKDDQVKYMGYRIELAEIENALIAIKYINDAAAIISLSEKYSVLEISAFIVSDYKIKSNEILNELKNILPSYMIPKNLIQIDNITRTDRGKVNRQALLKRI